MIILEFSCPEFLKFKKKAKESKYFNFWKDIFNNKITWAICLLFVKITYVDCNLKTYTDYIEAGKTEWKS